MPFKYDYKKIAEATDIYAVAKHLDIAVMKDRANCPACDSDNALQFYSESNTFRCWSIKESGDCIDLYVHIKGGAKYHAARFLQDQFDPSANAERSTTPQKPDGASQRPSLSTAKPAAPKKKEVDFDPVAFASKLVFTDEVAALGLTEADATRLGIGFTRGRVYFPMKDDTGFICGFIGWSNGELKMPPKWLEQSKVVKLKRA